MADAIGDLELFLAIVASGNLSAAARATRSSPAAVSRRLSALERRLGVRLAERNARRFRLTDEGQVYAERGRRIVEVLNDVEAEVSAGGTVARGLLKVGAPTELGRRRVAAILAAFAAQHPGVVAHLTLSDAGLEAGQDGIDVVLRFGLPDDQGLVARRMASLRRIICAAPSYLARDGAPVRIEDLARHACLALTRRHGVPDRWSFRIGTEDRAVDVSGHLSSGSGEAIHAWALAGHGIAREAEWDVTEDLAAGRLVALLTDVEMPALVLYATYAPGRPVPPRVRLFVDFVAVSLSRRGEDERTPD
jgi:DNA-binding transcriptional LysR family regulator